MWELLLLAFHRAQPRGQRVDQRRQILVLRNHPVESRRIGRILLDAQLNDHASSDDLAKLLVGNKSDLEASREVPREKAEQFCHEYGMEMLETSAKSGENVLQSFEKLIGIVHERALAQQKAKGGMKALGNQSGHIKLGEDGSGADGTGGSDSASACGC